MFSCGVLVLSLYDSGVGVGFRIRAYAVGCRL